MASGNDAIFYFLLFSFFLFAISKKIITMKAITPSGISQALRVPEPEEVLGGESLGFTGVESVGVTGVEDLLGFGLSPSGEGTVPQGCRQRNLLTNASVISIVAALFDGQFALRSPVGSPPDKGYDTAGLDQFSILFNSI